MRHLLHGRGGLLRLGEFGLKLAHASGDIDAELLRVELGERRMALDAAVAQRLGDGGVVDFGVAVTAIADEVDDHVAVEGVAVFGGKRGDAHDGSGIFGVDVEDGDGQAAREIGGEARGVGLVGLGGEADEVVDDDVNATADGEAFDFGEIQGFGPDALTGEGGVSVNGDGEDAVDAVGAPASLLGAGAAHGDRIDGLEMAGVRDEVQGNPLVVAGVKDAGGSDVVFHVAAAKNAARVDVFELGEDVGGRLAEGVDHDAETSAVAHGHD